MKRERGKRNANFIEKKSEKMQLSAIEHEKDALSMKCRFSLPSGSFQSELRLIASTIVVELNVT